MEDRPPGGLPAIPLYFCKRPDILLVRAAGSLKLQLPGRIPAGKQEAAQALSFPNKAIFYQRASSWLHQGIKTSIEEKSTAPVFAALAYNIDRASCQEGLKIIYGNVHKPGSGFLRSPGNMRRDITIFRCQERIFRQGGFR